MTLTSRIVLALAGLGLLPLTPAIAADYDPPIYTDQAPDYVPVEVGSGWYLRGDVGYAFTDLRGARYFQGSNDNEVDFDKAELRDSWTIGGGVGYQVNNYLRTDVTFDYLSKAKFHGATIGSCGVSDDCTSKDISSLTAYSLLANAYVDLGTYGAFTPYVGAGIGGSYVKWKNLQNTSCDTNDDSFCDDTVSHGGKGDWRFAYALMAGASIDITCNVKADVGYRYMHINGGSMFGYAENGGPGRDRGVNIHEARVGARYLFGGCQQASYEPPPEIPLQQPVYK
jgi:opacity protein-like surface antigen